MVTRPADEQNEPDDDGAEDGEDDGESETMGGDDTTYTLQRWEFLCSRIGESILFGTRILPSTKVVTVGRPRTDAKVM